MPLACDWALFCERAYFDPPQKPWNLCLVHLIEHVMTDTFPVVVKPFMLAAHVAGYTATTAVALRVVAPSGSEGLPTDVAPLLGVEDVSPYLLFRFGAVTFHEEGIYRFEILFDHVVARTVRLPVMRLAGAIAPSQRN